jgi:hypothetical protein
MRANSRSGTWFSGLPELWVQDSASQSGLDPILDRTDEHLYASDTSIHGTAPASRKHWGIRENGRLLPGAADPEATMARAISLHVAKGADWRIEGERLMRAELGKYFDYAP